MSRDWRDTLRAAADLALLGILLTIACLPVVTAGAAVATASTAVRHFAVDDGWPRAVDIGRTFIRALIPGLVATAVALGAGALIALDLAALRSGAVPGGRPLLALTAVLAAAGAGFAGLIVVAAGSHGWRRAVRDAAVLAAGRPATLVAATGVLAIAAVLAALLHPVVAPILVGYALYALHAVVYGGRVLVRRSRTV
jgi:hypothetical protein